MTNAGIKDKSVSFSAERSLARLPDHLFEDGDEQAVITFMDDDKEEWTRRELGDCVRSLSEGLGRDGLAPDSKVLIFAPASPRYFAAALAVIRAGGIVVPIDVQMSDPYLEHVFKDSEATSVFTTKRLTRRLTQLGLDEALRVFLLDAEEDEKHSWRQLLVDDPGPPAEVGGNAVAVLFYTSGTTGQPKGVPLSHANLISEIRVIEKTRLLKEGDRMLLPLPLHHVYPFVIGVLTPLALNVPIVLPYALTGAAITRAMREARVTIVLGVPRLYGAILRGVRDKVGVSGGIAAFLFESLLTFSRLADRMGLHMGRRLFRSVHRKAGPDIRILASGGSPLEPGLASDLEALGWPVAVGYGLTETSPLLTFKWPYKGRHGSVGRAIEGVELKIDFSALSSGEEENQKKKRGELLARGPNVFFGYHKMPEETEKSFTGGWFRTGDIAGIDDQGYVYLHGRVSTMIVRESGENVDPEKVEEVYEECDEIQEIGVLEDDGSLAGLVVPGKEFTPSRETEELRKSIRSALEKCAERLPSYQRVSRFQITKKPLERTRLGKLKREELSKAYEIAKAGNKRERQEQTGPVSEEEMSSEDRVLMEDERVRSLWGLLAGRYPDKPLSPDAHLEFDLEIDSMERIELSMALEEQIRVPVDESQLEEVDYVRDLMELVAEHEGDEDKRTGHAVTDPEKILAREDVRRAETRGRAGNLVVSIVYTVGSVIMRLFFRPKVKGLEHIPKAGPFIILPNHVSILDAPILALALGRKRALGCFWAGSSRLLFRNTFTRSFSRLAQVVPIEREADPVSSIAFGALLLKRERPLVWFPEGRISPSGGLQPFRQGIGLLLEHYDRPVIPVVVDGTSKALPPGRRIPRPAEIVVHFGDPLEVQDLRVQEEHEKGTEALHARIVRKLEEAVAELQKKAGIDSE